MRSGTVYVIELPTEGPKFVGYTEADLSFRLSQIRAQKGVDPVLVWIQGLGENRFDLQIRALQENCPRENSREMVRSFVIQYTNQGYVLLNGNCRKRVNRGTGSPIASEPTYIYTLKHPVTNEIRYVGKTVDLRIREKGHRQLGKTRCDNWKRSLVAVGLWPILDVVETVSVGQDWAERERFWIRHYRDQGANLTNLTDGGEGTHGRVITDSYREKLRTAFKGRPIPQEQRELISKTLTGKVQSPETVAKRINTINERRASKGLPLLGTYRERYNQNRRETRRASGSTEKFSPEWKAKIAEGMRRVHANMTEDERERQRQMRSGKPAHNKGVKYGPQSPERRAHQSDKLKTFLANMTPEQREARMTAARAARKAKLGY